MYFTRKNNIIFVVGVLIAMLIIAPVLFFVLHPEKKVKKENNKISVAENQASYAEKKAPFDAQKPVRTQEEIWTGYEKNINTLLNLVNSSEEDTKVILDKVETGFFDIFVPNQKKDLHIQTLLQIQKLKSSGSIDSKEKMREYIVPLLTALLQK